MTRTEAAVAWIDLHPGAPDTFDFIRAVFGLATFYDAMAVLTARLRDAS